MAWTFRALKQALLFLSTTVRHGVISNYPMPVIIFPRQYQIWCALITTFTCAVYNTLMKSRIYNYSRDRWKSIQKCYLFRKFIANFDHDKEKKTDLHEMVDRKIGLDMNDIAR